MIYGKILGIETSCDETGASIVESNGQTLRVVSNALSTSIKLHVKTGGIIPESAAREQLKYIIPVLKEALQTTKITNPAKQIDAIAVTVGPGLIGSLLVGVETAKTLSYIWKIPIIPVNHLYGHIFANFIGEMSNVKSQISKDIRFPAIALVVSGGHTDHVLMKNFNDLEWIGGTRDDAAGECLDKVGRLLGLPYPAGAEIEKLAEKGNPKRFIFPSPLIDSKDFDFSFSGLKTAVLREVEAIEQLNNQTIQDISASVQNAVIKVLVKKTLKAAKEFNARSILLGGGVAANNSLRENFKFQISNFKLDTKLFVPDKKLCTDNAAMIAAAGFFAKESSWKAIDASPSLHF
ncbi:MAG: tRNA (adenosine(37)-N6)-threonylcarbamoyltransferase complex transferase subunit TsaD [Patescibacteria group bacterium]